MFWLLNGIVNGSYMYDCYENQVLYLGPNNTVGLADVYMTQ